MWPFTKSELKPPNWRYAAIEELRDWKKIGEEFQYLGRTMVVTAHFETVFSDMGCASYPGIEADYADDCGRIHQLKFSWAESKALMVNNR